MSVMNSYETALSGGIVDEQDPRLDSVSARSYEHPALGSRTVVRLVADTLGQAEDVTLEFFGFSAVDSRPVGYQLRQGLGFPGWALIHDPQRAAFALEVVKDFRKHAKTARAKPGFAKDGFDAIAARLGNSVPHFLPSYYEEAGRVFLDNGNVSYAATMFGKARQAEKVHALKVDESLRRETFLEFALAGAVTVKTIAWYGKDLESEHAPELAFQHFRELCLRRTLGGMPPWSAMLKDIKRLAKNAGLDVKAEEKALLKEIVEAPAMARAAVEFWTSAAASVADLCRESEGLADLLLDLRPEFSGDSVKHGATWLGLLEKWGLYERLATRPRAAAWLSSMLGHFGGQNPDPLFAVVTLLAPILAREGEPVTMTMDWRGVDLDMLEHLLSLGLRVDLKRPAWSGVAYARLEDWAETNSPERRRDPIHVASDPHWLVILVESLERDSGTEPFESISVSMEGWKIARRHWLESKLSRLETEALPSCWEILGSWEGYGNPRLLEPFPDLVQRLRQLPMPELLARTVRGGLPEELAWPALEEAMTELGGVELQLDGIFPVAVVRNAAHAIAVDRDTILARHDVVVPPGAKLDSVLYLDGLFLTLWWKDYEKSGSWSDGRTFSPQNHYGVFFHKIAVAVPGVGVTFGKQAFQAGDKTAADFGYGSLFGDGSTFWEQFWHEGEERLKEVDPKTGREGRVSLPKFFEDWADPDHKLQLRQSSLFPLPAGQQDSVLGGKNGLAGWRLRQRLSDRRYFGESISGLTYEGEALALGMVGLPGTHLLFQGVALATPQYAVSNHAVSPEALVWRLPSHWWHLLRWRSEKDSHTLRTASPQQLESLTFDDPVLSQAYTQVLKSGREVFEKLLGFAQDPGSVGAVVKASEVSDLLSSFSVSVSENHLLTSEVTLWERLLAGSKEQGEPPAFLVSFAGYLGALAWRSIAPFTEPSQGQAAFTLLEAFSGSVFVSEPERLRRVELEIAHDAMSDGRIHFYENGSHYLFYYQFYHGIRYVGLEISTDGLFRNPARAKLLKEEPVDNAWETPERILAFVSAARKNGALSWNAEHPRRLAELTGMSYAEACLLWIGFAHINSWEANFLPTSLRETMGLKAAEAKLARENLRRLTTEQRLTLFRQAMPEDPTELWSDTIGCVERLARAWNQQQGVRIAVPEATLKELSALSRQQTPAEMLSVLANPQESPLALDAVCSLDEDGRLVRRPEGSFHETLFLTVTTYLCYLFEYAAAGDPLRNAVANAWPFVEERLKNPKQLFDFGSIYEGEKDAVAASWEKAIGGTDNGKVMMAADRWSVRFFYRPALVADDDLVLNALEKQLPYHSGWRVLKLVRSEAFQAMVERMLDTKVPAGGYEANPALSCPELVSEVVATLAISAEAATLYLQTLALAKPTSKNVGLWNGWTTAVYKKATKELVDKGLLLEAKRARAGRSHFLPGGWKELRTPHLPIETWKFGLYGISEDPSSFPLEHLLAARPLHELFAQAWQKVQDGQGPAYEEVR